MNIRKIIIKILIIVTICGMNSGVMAQDIFTDSEKSANRDLGTIYIIGNDNLGEIEYYSKELNTFKGIMPEFYKKIGEISRLDLQYLEVKTDRQEEIRNTQAEIVTLMQYEQYPEIVDKVRVFTLPNGEEIYLGFTKIVDNELKENVKKAISSLTSEEREKVILNTLQTETQTREQEQNYTYTIGVIVLIVLILISVYFYTKKLKNRVRKEKYSDKITGYSNFENFEKSFDAFINDEIKANYCLIDLGLDMTRIEEIYGYKEVEENLRNVAQILDEYVKDNEMFCRKTNNSFILLLDYISQKHLEERILFINERIRNSTSKYALDVKFGVYYFKSANYQLDIAIYYAMQARKVSEETGKLYTVCNKSLMSKIDEENSLEKEIAGALKKQEFISYIQPIINTKENKVFAMEVLARWENERYGFIKPRRFLKILEKSNMVYELDMLMFKNACELLERLGKDNNVRVFCNFYRNSFSKEDFVDNIKQLIDEYKIEPELIGIVITEDILSKHTYNIKKIVKELKDMGLLIILDNYGGTTESLNDIAEMECDFIKISPKLLNNIELERKQFILRQVIRLVQNLGTEVICENIEKREIESILSNMGCKLLQGNLYCSAIPVEEIHECKI